MSRIGKEPIALPTGVTVKINGREVTVTGPKGELINSFSSDIQINIKDNFINLEIKNVTRFTKAIWGTTRTLIANMVLGVTDGFEKNLKIVGTGFRAKLEENKLTLSLGFSHPVEYIAPAGIKLEVIDQDKIKITGADKYQVGQTAANIRKIQPPDHYKGKGIRYADEIVKTKPGKTGKAVTATGK